MLYIVFISVKSKKCYSVTGDVSIYGYLQAKPDME